MSAFGEIGAGIDSDQPHLVHMPDDRFAIDLHPFPLELLCDSARSIAGMVGGDLINPMLECNFFG
ncbi:hypothetical protein KSD_69610 [Ktedonobacter sp. SOSP1-85]|nr:hypothetical protein KSD_69610 [Ktedonobacter sp. SOSP1-85]